MTRSQPTSANFEFLREHEPQLVLLAAQAETLFAIDPVASLGKLRLFAELLAQEVAARVGLYTSRDENQVDLLRRLRERGALTGDADQLFHTIRKAGNRAVHENVGTHRDALHCLELARILAIWFHRTFGKQRDFRPGPFQPPRSPFEASDALREELEALRAALAAAHADASAAKKAAEDAAARARTAEERAALEAEERAAAEALMAEAAAREAAMLERLASVQKKAAAEPERVTQQLEVAAELGADLDLDEAATRVLIDAQLRAAGWEADTTELRYSAGVRPQKGKNLAIAEWPTDVGPADYVLFVGLTPIAVVEAKRRRKDVSSALEQARRYAEAFRSTDGTPVSIPFLFATNGRPYLRQLAEKSGIWFRDARRPQNLGKPLADWYTPEGLVALSRQDIDAANQRLAAEPTDYLGLRDYQLRAIHAAEEAIVAGKRAALLAMATGTGKTRTCIGLCYRLLKAGRFRRILFLVDRSALGEQAANAFKDARLEALQTFDSIFDLKTLEDVRPDPDTKLHIATVQGMVKRILYADDDVPPVDAYDCIIVDECHRGYLLDREMSDSELAFRSEADYISKYRRVLDHFDAVKIGLTATPAQHTREIFGDPVFTYSYREAVVDGYLVDHEPPIRITTKLSRDGITFQAGEEVTLYLPRTDTAQLALLPDEVHVEVEEFNKRVVTESFNRMVCEVLAAHIDPHLDAKTLVFCVSDFHADMVVRLLREALAARYGEVEHDAVLKITGSADRPLELIRRFKNERQPNIAVTVDLLTTGVDVPKISNLVFLRRVRSRILYEQMIGRATRLCEDIGKEVFHIYDAVDLYAALAPFSDMKPVAASVSIPFAQLVRELTTVKDEKHREEVLGQLIVKLDRKRRRMKGAALERFEAATGMEPAAFLDFLRKSGTEVARQWFVLHPGLGELLDRTGGDGGGMLVSTHEDELVSVERGYGEGRERPEDYLEGFNRYIAENLNRIPALLVVTQRPRDLTREQLKELRLALDEAGYTEAQLRAAWRDRTNEDIAASIIGHIRQAALGDPLVPYDERVSRALKRILASRQWTDPQRKWLERIGKQLRQEVVVDKQALDRGQFAAEGGFNRMNRVFEGQLETILGDLADEVWKSGT